MYYLFRLAEIVIPRLPRRLVRALGSGVALIAWLVAAKARRQATGNIRHVLGGQDEQARRSLQTWAGRRRLRKIVRGMFKQNVSNYLDLFLLPGTKPETILQQMDLHGLEHIQAALALGKGVIIFSGHYGPFDYLVQWLAIQGQQVVIPVEQLADSRILDLVLRLRRSQGIQYVPLGGSKAMRAMLQALRHNHVVLITADRAVQGEFIEVPFFGAPARLPLGIVELAQRTGAPIVGGFGWPQRENRGVKFVAELAPLSLALPEEQRKQTDLLMSGIVAIMERYIGARPQHWVVFAPIWVAPETTTQQQLMQTVKTPVSVDEERHDNE